MSGRPPDEIWEDGLAEGERRLARGVGALIATSLAGGTDVFIGVVAMAVTTGGLHAAMPEATAHALASLTFGIGIAFITLGRAELFTENFLIPVATVWAGRARFVRLLRIWGVSLGGNVAGLALLALIFAAPGVLSHDALHAAGTMADAIGGRGTLAALLSAIAAGMIMTLFTWVVAAAESASARLLASLLVGFVLAAPSLNHAVIGFGEQLLGLLAGTARSTWLDLLRTVALAIAGNMLGGVVIVFGTRLAQVRGEPDSQSGARETPRAAGLRSREDSDKSELLTP
jgi:formate/nitrite transporter FocA (FNT family)